MSPSDQALYNLDWRTICDNLGLPPVSQALGDLLVGVGTIVSPVAGDIKFDGTIEFDGTVNFYTGDLNISTIIPLYGAPLDIAGSLTVEGAQLGAKELIQTLTPVDAGTVTIVYAAGSCVVVDMTALDSTDAFTLAVSGAPSTRYQSTYTLILKTNTTIPTITWPSGYTAPIIVANSENWYSASSIDGGTTTRLFSLGSF